MLAFSFQKILLQLKYTWAIARGSTNEKTNYIITFKDCDGIVGLGEIAPNLRYGETLEGVEKQLQFISSLKISETDFLNELKDLEVFNSVRFGLESAWISYHCNKKGISISSYFEIPAPHSVYTAYTIPIMDVGEMRRFFEKHQLHRFKMLKIKIGAENGADMIKEVGKFSSQPMIVDANEAFLDPLDILNLLATVKECPVVLMEQPFPAGLKEAYIDLKPKSPVPVFADESVTSHFDIHEISQQFHGVNMKLMKAGGWHKGVEILKATRSHGLQTMIGCMVETTLAISHGWHLCGLADVVDLDSFMVIDQEPFGLVNEKNGELTLA